MFHRAPCLRILLLKKKKTFSTLKLKFTFYALRRVCKGPVTKFTFCALRGLPGPCDLNFVTRGFMRGLCKVIHVSLKLFCVLFSADLSLGTLHINPVDINLLCGTRPPSGVQKVV